MSFLKNFLGPVWLVYVLGWYLSTHSYYLTSWQTIKMPVLILVILWTVVAGTFWLIQTIRKKKSLTLTPLTGLLLAFFMIWSTGVGFYGWLNPAVFESPHQIVFYDEGQFALVEEGVELNEGLSATITRGEVLMHWNESKELFPVEIQALFIEPNIVSFAGGLALNLLILFGAWIFFLLLFHNLGATALSLKRTDFTKILQSIGLGMGMMMLALFVLGVLGQFNVIAAWIVTGLIIIASAPKVVPLFKWFKKAKTKIIFNKLHWWSPIALLSGGIIISLNVVDALKPFVNGFDSLNAYQNTPNLLVQYGHLIKGIAAYNFELITSLGHLLFSSSMISQSLTILGALLAFSMLFILLKKTFDGQNAFLLTVLFAIIPMNVFLMNIDLKIDLPLLFFSLLAIHSAVEWYQHRDKAESKKHLILTGIWLGIALGIKYTTMMLVATIFAFFAYATWGFLGMTAVGFIAISVLIRLGPSFVLDSFSAHVDGIILAMLLGIGVVLGIMALARYNLKWKQLRPFIITGFILSLVFAPWALKNINESHSLSPTSIMYGKKASLMDHEALGHDLSTCEDASDYNEIDNFLGDFMGNSLLSPAVLLWEATINSKMPNNRISDIGFLFLGFAVFIFFAWGEVKKEEPKIAPVMAFTILYGLFWLLTSRGIIWYGMPVFVGLMVVYGKSWKTEKWVYGVIALWLVMSLFLRVYSETTQNEYVISAGGMSNESIYTENFVAGAEDISAIINTEEALSQNVYLVDQFFPYFVEQNHTRVYKDDFLNQFICLFYDENPEVIIAGMKEAGFGFIVYSDYVVKRIGRENDELQDQFRAFEYFAENYLVREVYRENRILYRIP